MVTDTFGVEDRGSGKRHVADVDEGNGPGGKRGVNSIKASEETSSFIISCWLVWRMISEFGKGSEEGFGVLPHVGVSGGRRFIRIMDRDTGFIGWEKVPVSSSN